MDLENLDTVAAVFTALGGNAGVEEITESKPSTVSMWKTSASGFPTNTYLVLIEALHKRNKTASASLWGMKVPVDADASCE